MKQNEAAGEKQTIEQGYGAPFHRRYSIHFHVPDPELARRAMADLQTQPNLFSPQIIARFEKLNGTEDRLQKGDEFQIHITGPWNGPVRVTEVHPHEFRFITLEGHLEAGEIHFEVRCDASGNAVFIIESLARSKDSIADFVYDKIPIARFAQTQMWTSFCKNFAKHAANLAANAGSTKAEIEDVEILTERYDEEDGVWKKI